ncbi:hypothetical protein GCM10010358_23450 [Streptomyces minutiscleroticus]|uniref:Uncharacterized protein n=1 Tax=Streptomyces minutiscleroticus TaxID=68238 RepID=A0A918KLI2_9ACTN|nr:hypothetical protein GCM10010358_23450 [Streptomyces minutiscleroticus]
MQGGVEFLLEFGVARLHTGHALTVGIRGAPGTGASPRIRTGTGPSGGRGRRREAVVRGGPLPVLYRVMQGFRELNGRRCPGGRDRWPARSPVAAAAPAATACPVLTRRQPKESTS